MVILLYMVDQLAEKLPGVQGSPVLISRNPTSTNEKAGVYMGNMENHRFGDFMAYAKRKSEIEDKAQEGTPVASIPSEEVNREFEDMYDQLKTLFTRSKRLTSNSER
jgi:hypothetical protein